MKHSLIFLTIVALFSTTGLAQLKLAHIFDNNMVIQRNQPVRVWGWGEPGVTVTVNFDQQERTTQVTKDGNWELYLDHMDANPVGQLFKVTAEGDAFVYQNVVIGDVWLLTGQSNMEFDLIRCFHGDEEVASANFPNIRLMTVPARAVPERAPDFERMNEWDGWYGRYDLKGYWLVCSPETVPTFAGMGYIFGRRIHMATQIPIGLVDISWGGTTIEGWITRNKLLEVSENQGLLKLWDARIQQDPEKANDRNNPGAAYNGMLACLEGMALTGIIWNQGFNNALGDSRPKLYSKNLKLMITEWRDAFNKPNLPFGIIELSAGGQPQTLENFNATMADAGAFIREAQFKAYLDLPDMGFVAAYDEQVNWYHPQKKVALGERMARWALGSQYGYDFGWEPTIPKSFSIREGEIIIELSKPVLSHDGRPIAGMALAGKDQKFYPAEAKYFISGKDDKGKDIEDRTRLVVSSKKVKKPVAVRYAWARNPLANLVNAAHHERVIPVPAFRSDDWDWPEAPFAENNTEEFKLHREKVRGLKK